ncbi:MAG: Ig-like domain-containing protein [Verrucomicrobiota bacterium JB025]|nr:Ig-like domain-containing protein [Verrucomicrobiota bacterium JB025]
MSTIPRLLRAAGMLLISSLAIGLSLALAVEPAIKILPLGDSLTSGLSSYSNPGAYRNQLHTDLTSAGYQVDFIGTFTDTNNPSLPDKNHQGLGGARIDQALTNLDGWFNQLESPDVVLVLLGTNDFWQNYDLANIGSRMEALIQAIATRHPFAKIIVSNLPLRIDDAGLEAQQAAFNDSLPALIDGQAALGYQVTLVDMHSAWTAADINGDGVHPNAGGFAKMADVWFPEISNVITPTGTYNPPVIVDVEPAATLDRVTLTFSKSIDDISTSLANFTVTGGLTITGATLDTATKRVITLATSAQTPGVVYTLSVSGVRDRTARHNRIAPETMVRFTSNGIINGSFEDDFTDWTTTGNVQIKQQGSYYVPTDGAKLAAFNTDDQTPNGTLSKSFPTSIGQTYELTLDFGILSFNRNQQSLQTTITGATQLVSDTVVMAGLGSGTNRWTPLAYSFVADSESTTVTFADLSTTSGSIDMLVDNVKVDSTANQTLSVTSAPTAGANITISPADAEGNNGGSTGLVRSYPAGTNVTLTAPASHNGAAFLGWRKNGVDQPSAGQSISITFADSVSLTAVFQSTSPPVAVADSYSTPANTTLNVPLRGVLENDFDGDNDYLTATLDSAPANGSLTLNPDGSFTYTPTAGFIGQDSFSYHAYDGFSTSATVQVSLTVFASANELLVNGSFENDLAGWTPTGNQAIYSTAPYAPTDGAKLLAFNQSNLTPNATVSQSFATLPGETYALSFDVGALAYNFLYQKIGVSVDGSSNLLSQTISVRGPGQGNTTWISKNYSFVANSSTTTLTFTDLSTSTNGLDLVLDNVSVSGNSASHLVTIETTPATGIAIGVSPGDLSGNTSGLSNFSRTFSAGTIVNLSAPASAGSDFERWLKDGADFSTSANISVTIDADATYTALYGVNEAPVANDDSFATQTDTPVVIDAPGLLSNDTDPEAATLTAVLDSQPQNGTLVLSPDGGFSYSPDAGYQGTDSFTYHVNDGAQNSAPATVTISIAPFVAGGIFNGGFEDGESGWTGTGNRLVVDAAAPYIPTEGNRLMVFNAGQATPNATLTQEFGTTPGAAYLLELDMGALGSPGLQQRLGIAVDGNANLLSVLESLTTNGFTSTIWQPLSYLFVADSDTTTITLADASPTGTNADLLLDNLRITAASAFAITVESSLGSGLPVTATPADLNGTTDGTAPFTLLHTASATVTLTAPTTHEGEDFIKWQKDGADLATTPAITVTVDSGMTLTAIYTGNSAPLAAADAYQTGFDQALVVAAPGVLGNDADSELDPLTAALDTTTTHGTLVLDADGGFSYTPTAGYSGPDSFTYHANDGSADSETVTVTLTVGAPLAGQIVNGSFESGDDSTSPVTALDDWTVTGSPFGYLADANYTATDGLRIAVFNGGGNNFGGSISQMIATTPGDTYELAFDAGIFGGAGKMQRLQVTVDGTTRVLTETVNFTSNGATTAQYTTRAFAFEADSTIATITFTDASGSLGGTATSSDLLLDRVSITKLTPNQTPLATDDSYSVPTDGTITTTAPGVLENDTDADADPLTASLVTGTANGTLTLNPDGSFTYSPDASFEGGDTFTYTASDGTNDSNAATVTITVGSTSELVSNGSFEIGDDSAAPLTALDDWTVTGSPFGYLADANYTATDGLRIAVFNGGGNNFGGSISQTLPTSPGATYELSFDTGIFGTAGKQQQLAVTVDGETRVLSETIALTAASGPAQWTSHLFTFTADSASSTLTFTDNTGATGNNSDLLVDLVSVIGAAGNTAPTATGDTYSTPQETTLTVAAPGVLGNDADPNSDPLTATLVSGPANGALTLNPDGGFSYTPASGFTGFDSFTYQANDGALDSDPATVGITVSFSDPVAVANGGFESGESGWSMTGNRLVYDSSAPYLSTEGDKLIIFNNGQSAPNATISQAIATIPGQGYRVDFDFGAYGQAGSKQSIRLDLAGDGPLVSTQNTATATGFAASVWQSRTVVFVANSDQTTLTFTDISQTTFNVDLLLDHIRVTPENAVALTILTATGSGLDIAVSPADLNGNSGGTADFHRFYQPGTPVSIEAPATFAGEDFVSWQIGGTGFSTSAATTVTLDDNTALTAVYTGNTAPSASPDSYVTAYETTLTVPAPGVLGNDTDADSDPLTAVVDSLPANGTLTLGADGGFTYQPDPGYSGPDSFDYHAADAKADSATVTVTITVNPEGAGSLVNGSFEDDDNGWTTSGNYFVIESQPPYIATDGGKLLVANGGNLPPSAVLSQDIATTPGVTYLLALDMGIVGPLASRQTLAVNVSGLSPLVSETENLVAIGASSAAWTSMTYSFVADAATTTITLSDVSADGNGKDLLVDNIRVTPLIPQTLIVESSGTSAVAITATPADLNGESDGTTSFSRSYNKDSSVTLTAPAVAETASFQKWQIDGADFSTEPSITITMDAGKTLTAIYEINEAPAAADDSFTAQLDTRLTVPAPGVLGNDSDPNSDPLTAVLETGPANGSLTLNPDGSFSYTPDASYTGPDSFTYHANDGELASAAATVSISVQAIATGTMTNGSFENTLDGWTTSGNLVVFDSATPYLASDGSRLMVFNNGQTTPNGVITQTVATTPGQSYTVSFDVAAIGKPGAQQRIRLDVTGTGLLVSELTTLTGPGMVAPGWTSRAFTYIADSTSTTITFTDVSPTSFNIDLLLDNVRNISELPVPRTLTLASLPADGAAITVTPADLAGNDNGITGFTRSFNEGSEVTLTAAATSGGLPFSRWQKNGTDLATTLETTIMVDGDITLTAVYAPNEAPVATPDSYTATVDTPLVIPAVGVLANDTDPEDDPLTAVLVTAPSNGSLTLNSDGSFTYTPATAFAGTDSFSYLANDGTSDSQPATVEITVTQTVTATLVNGSFEDAFNGWQTTGNLKVDTWPAPTDGSALVVLNSANSTPNATLTQSFATTPGVTYTLSFDYGVFAYNTSQQRLGVTLTGTSLLLSQTATINGTGSGNINWSSASYDFTADSPTTTLTLTDTSPATNALDMLLDNIRLSTGSGSPVEHTLTIASTAAASVPISVSPADLDGSSAGTTPFNRRYNDGASVTLTAPATSGSATFVKWQQDGSDIGTTTAITVTVDSGTTVTAVYENSATGTLIANGSFENEFDSWTESGSSPDAVKVDSQLNAPDGDYLVAFNSGDSTPDGSIAQTFATTTGSTYQLDFDIATFSYTTNLMRLAVKVTANSTVLDTTASLTGVGGGTIDWQSRSYTFVADGPNSTLSFTDTSTATTGIDILLDNVRVTLVPDAPVLRNLSVASSGISGVDVTVTPADENGNSNGPTPWTRIYQDNTAVTITAPAASGSATFVKWQQNGADLDTAATVTITMDDNHSLLAVYDVPAPTPVEFVNGSFEDGLTGWSVTGTPDTVRVSTSSAAQDGSKLAEFNATNLPNDGTLAQSFATTPGTSYSVAFKMGVLAFNYNWQTLGVAITGDGLLANQDFSMRGQGGGRINWTSNELTFTANSSSTTLTFTDKSTTSNSLDTLLDSVTVDTLSGTPDGQNLIINGSFEEAPDYFGWSHSGATRIEKPGSAYATNGNHLLSFNVGNEPLDGEVIQTFTTVPGTTYQISYDVGTLGFNDNTQTLRVTLTGNTLLLDESTTVQAVPATAALPEFMVWESQAFTFIADSTSTTLKLEDASTTGNGLDLFVDAVDVHSTAAIAEAEAPATGKSSSARAITGDPTRLAAKGTLELVSPALLVSPESCTVCLHSAEPGTYILQRSTDLVHWTNLGDPLEHNGIGTVEFTDTDTTEPTKYYRIFSRE